MEYPKNYNDVLMPIRGYLSAIIEPIPFFGIIDSHPIEHIATKLLVRHTPEDEHAHAPLLAEAVRRYVMGPIITDRFSNHQERRDWLKKLSKSPHPEIQDARKAYLENILRRSLVVYAVMVTEKCIGEESFMSPAQKALIFGKGIYENEYNDLSDIEKIRTAVNVRSVIHNTFKTKHLSTPLVL